MRPIKNVIFILIIVIAAAVQGQTASNPNDVNTPVDKILSDLKKETSQLQTYQAQIDYKFSQPLFESQTLRTGKLFFKNDDKSKLRIEFNTIKQDQEKSQKYLEHIIFDGVWLTHIDYQTKQARKIQQAEPNQPINGFELLSQNFPIIGFSENEDLRKQFEISLVQSTSEPNGFTELLLKVKPDSIYKDDYSKINFKIDKKLNLPAQIIAETVDEEIYIIELTNPRFNQKLSDKLFEAKIPENFDVEYTPLSKDRKD